MTNPRQPAREGIILTAMRTIHELGIRRLSTGEIFGIQGISRGKLFRKFKRKNEIIIGVLYRCFKYYSDIIEPAMLEKPKTRYVIEYFEKAYSEFDVLCQNDNNCARGVQL